MKIHLLSDNPIMEICWLAYFRDIPDVTVTCDTLEHFITNNKVDCIVSPANSYGLMDGGFDLAITTVFALSKVLFEMSAAVAYLLLPESLRAKSRLLVSA